MVGKLVDEGVLKFDSAISDLLPDISMQSQWAECSLEHLLTHISGLPANFPKRAQKIDPSNSTDLVLARRDLIQRTLSKPPKTPSGSEYLYSNLGYAIIGHVVETQTNSCYGELIREEFFEPCGLDSAGFGPLPGEGSDDQPSGTGHFLKTDTWQRLHTPVKDDYAYGWVISESAGGREPVIWHKGSNTMWYALLLLSSEKDFVLASVTNNGAIRKAERAFTQAVKQIADQLD